MHCLARKTLKCNSLVHKICLFLQKETSHCKSSLALGPEGPKQYIFDDHFYSKNAKKLRFHLFLLFHVMGPQDTELDWNKFKISCEFDPLQVKWWYHMFSELSCFFLSKNDARNIALGSLGTHFMHMRVNNIVAI